MPAKSAATKKKKVSKRKTAAKSSRRKSVAKKAPRKTVAKKKVTKKKATKKKVTKKKVTKKKVTKKKVAKKRPSAKKATKKKVAKKSTAKKKPTQKAAAKRKSSTRKETVAKKASTKKRPTAKKAAAGRTSTKRPPAKRTPTRPRASRSKRGSNVLTGPVRGFEAYRPTRGEDYMSDEQLVHFHELLTAWKRELMEEVDRTMLHMKDDAANFPDPNDRATQESEFGLELRTRDRERKLIKKIDSALQRVDDRSYGFCEETGDEIGLRRLEARPVATLCVEAQERRELAERQFRDREDHYR